jgi:hypothetical protein
MPGRHVVVEPGELGGHGPGPVGRGIVDDDDSPREGELLGEVAVEALHAGRQDVGLVVDRHRDVDHGRCPGRPGPVLASQRSCGHAASVGRRSLRLLSAGCGFPERWGSGVAGGRGVGSKHVALRGKSTTPPPGASHQDDQIRTSGFAQGLLSVVWWRGPRGFATGRPAGNPQQTPRGV